MSTAGVEAIVRQLADREAIRELTHRYAHCMWQKDAVGAVDLFTEDGEMDIEGRPVIRGRDSLAEAYQRMLADADFHPFVHNHMIDLDGESATGTCYLDLRARLEGKSMIGSGYYDDRYVRVGEEWKFRSRKLVMFYFVPLTRGWAEQQEEP